MQKGILYVIPSGINENPKRYLPADTLSQIHHTTRFIAERARTARRFLKAIQHPTPLPDISIREIPKKGPYVHLKEDLSPLSHGHNIGLLSEAGSPGVADPGAEVVFSAHGMNAMVVPLVGPSSILLALMASGINGQQFSFHGYLSPKRDQVGKDLKRLEFLSKKDRGSHLFIETPYRNHQIFEEALQHLTGSTYLSIALNLCHPEQLCRTQSIEQWKKSGPPQMHKIPCVFILQAT